MIRLIREFSNAEVLLNECSVSEDHILSGIYNKAKEIAVNLNDEIQKTPINDNMTFTGVIHKCTYYLDPNKIDIMHPPTCDMNDTVNVSMSSDKLRSKLYQYPKTIYFIANYSVEYLKNNEVEDYNYILSNIHAWIKFLAKCAMELISLVKIKTAPLTESYENVDDYISDLNKCIDDIRKYYDKSDYAKLLTPRKKKIDKMEEYVRGALERKYTLRIPLYKVEDAKKETREVIENKFIKDIQGIVANYKNYVVLSPNWDEDEDIYIYLTLKEPFGKEGDSKLRGIDSAEDNIDKLENPKVDTNANKEKTDKLTEASEFVLNGNSGRDDKIIDICKTLTSKGYTTVASCEGHVEDAKYLMYKDKVFLQLGAYVKFDKHYKFNTMPKYWDYESNDIISVNFPNPPSVPKSYLDTYARRCVYIRKADANEMNNQVFNNMKEPISILNDREEIGVLFNIFKNTYLDDLKIWADSLPVNNEDASLNESSNKLTKEERDKLPDSEFGIPSLRKYPLNDEKHIKQAIKMFHYCKPKYKKELANNIAKKVKEKNLVDKVKVSHKNPFKNYFPTWIIENSDSNNTSKNKVLQNESVVFINDKLI